MLTLRKEVSLGTVLQILGMLCAGILWWDRSHVAEAQRGLEQQQIMDELRRVHARLDGVEKYLSSRDPRYWEIIRQMNFTEASRMPMALAKQKEKQYGSQQR